MTLLLVDTREQLPYWKGKESAAMTLNVGDYTTVALLNKYHIERKSPQDLYGTLIKGNRRFKKELFRAEDNKIRLSVYVECSRQDFIDKNFPRGDFLKFPSHGLEKLINTFASKYSVEFVWHKNRAECKAAVLKRLKKEENKLNK
jgi:ERCC4-type nuclease